MIDPKEAYKIFCEKESSLPLFLSYNWLNTVAPHQWDVVLEMNEGEIIGVLPYILTQRKGFTFIELPALTPMGGVWIKYPEGQKYTSSLAYEKEVYTNLIDKLPPFDLFQQKLHPSIINWKPFYWKGFSQTTHYTFILEDISNPEAIYGEFKNDLRRAIRKAEQSITIEPSNDIEILYRLKLKSCEATGIKMNTTLDKLNAIHRFCIENNKGELLVAKEGDRIDSANLFVWDQQSCYKLYAASDPDYKNSNAMSLMVWTAIQRYSSRVKEFNFEGSMIEGVDAFFRSFGAKQVPYFVIKKTNSKILKLKNFLKEW